VDVALQTSRASTGRVSAGRVDYLDGIRALAIGAVLSLHWLSWYSPFLHGGSVGVDVFFVLSGFIITTMLWRSRGPAGVGAAWWVFVKRRVIRLYPALLGLVVGAIVLYAVIPSAPLSPFEVTRRGLFSLSQVSAVWAAGQSGSLWLPALHPFGQTWSLAIEWYFYLLWPLVVLAARARGLTPGRLAVGSLVAAVPLYLVALPLSDFWFYFGPSARFAELLVGAALALWFQAKGTPTGSQRSSAVAPWAALAAICAITVFAPAAHSPFYRYVEVPVAALATVVLIFTGYSSAQGPVHRLLSHPWLAAVGRCSYSLYLWHIVPMLLLEKTDLGLSRPVLGLLTVAATVVLTAASYRFLERPFLRPRGDVLRPAPGRDRTLDPSDRQAA
jgi:peptidoglycan/LPS O-acetylase OafA/YrhL